MPLAAALIPVAGSLISSVIGSNQTSRAVGAATDWSKQAANKIGESVSEAQAGQNSAYDAQTANLNPYLQAGQQGITSLSQMLQPGGELTKQFGFDATNLQNEPGYQFQLQQGNKAVNNAHAANGLAGSGAQSKALAQYGQGLAGTTYQNAYNRALTTFQTNRQNTLAPLSTLINAGQTATGQFDQAAQSRANFNGNAGMQGAKSIADIFQNIGGVKAAGSVAQGNTWSSFANSATQGIGDYLSGRADPGGLPGVNGQPGIDLKR